MGKKGILITSFEEFIDADFAIIKAGFTDYNINKTKYIDRNFEKNYLYAKDNNIDIGVYYDSCATSIKEVKEELNFFFNIIKNKIFEYPIFIRMRDDHNTIIYNPKNHKTIGKIGYFKIIEYVHNYISKIITFNDYKNNDYLLEEIDNIVYL